MTTATTAAAMRSKLFKLQGEDEAEVEPFKTIFIFFWGCKKMKNKKLVSDEK